jgi:hypothetical protein
MSQPTAAKSMIEFEYTGKYSVCSPPIADQDADNMVQALHKVNVYTIAVKYNFPGLSEYAKKCF